MPRFACPLCNHVASATEEQRGGAIVCSGCRKQIRVPRRKATPAPEGVDAPARCTPPEAPSWREDVDRPPEASHPPQERHDDPGEHAPRRLPRRLPRRFSGDDEEDSEDDDKTIVCKDNGGGQAPRKKRRGDNEDLEGEKKPWLYGGERTGSGALLGGALCCLIGAGVLLGWHFNNRPAQEGDFGTISGTLESVESAEDWKSHESSVIDFYIVEDRACFRLDTGIFRAPFKSGDFFANVRAGQTRLTIHAKKTELDQLAGPGPPATVSVCGLNDERMAYVTLEDYLKTQKSNHFWALIAGLGFAAVGAALGIAFVFHRGVPSR
jgi:hypothetical protein